MPNIKNIIDKHNTNIQKKETIQNQPCNCRNKENCPLEGKCKEKSLVYQATVTTSDKTETYIGLTENDFKSRFANHKQSFKKEHLKNATELSKYIWTLKEKGTDFEMKWKIMGKAKPYSNVSKRCGLCNLEKYFIICHGDKATLNKKSELINTCRHAAKFKLDKL